MYLVAALLKVALVNFTLNEYMMMMTCNPRILFLRLGLQIGRYFGIYYHQQTYFKHRM